MSDLQAKSEKIQWLAPLYEHKEQSVDWFWALGVIIFATCVTSVIYKNYFFAILIALGGGLLWHFSIKKPGMVDYELNDKGFQIKNRLYPYEDIQHFWIQNSPSPILHIHSDRVFLPVLSMPIYPHIVDKIKHKLLTHGVKEEEIPEHPSVKVMEFLGF